MEDEYEDAYGIDTEGDETLEPGAERQAGDDTEPEISDEPDEHVRDRYRKPYGSLPPGRWEVLGSFAPYRGSGQ